MMIATRKSDHVVILAKTRMWLGEDGVYGQGWRDRTINPLDVNLFTVRDMPNRFLLNQYTYIDGVFSLIDDAAFEAAWTASEARKPVPQIVTMRQARLALLQAGLLSQVDAAINAMAEPDRSAAQIEWEYATEVKRSSGLVQSLAVGLNLSDQQVDDLFKKADVL